MSPLLSRLLQACVLLSLSACSLMPGQDLTPSVALQAEAARAELESWQLKGRLQTTEQRASLRWRQQAESFDLLLRGPFGFGGVRVTGSPALVEINDGQEVYVSADPVAEIYARTGLRVPLQALRYWALGLAAPAIPAHLTRNLAGHVSHIEQAGWLVELDDYQDLDGVAFPYAIRLRSAEQEFLITVSQWKLL